VDNKNKILVIIFFALLFILLIEIVFIFLVDQKQLNLTNLSNSNIDLNKEFVKANDENSKYLYDLFTKTLSFEEKEFYRNIFALNYPKSQYSSILLEKVIDGQIVKIEKNPGEFHPLAKYAYKFEIKIKGRPKNLTIFYSPEDIQNVNGLEKLEANNIISIKEIYDLKNLKLIKAEIIKK
jgi:hypothetical protein